MLKPASGHCNMLCTYCFYRDLISSCPTQECDMMTAEVSHKIINNVFSDLSSGDKVTFAFQGGEPTLAGLDFFEDFFTYARKIQNGIHVEYALQTNGMSIDDNWCSVFRKYSVLIGLSLDGYSQLHDANRKDAQGKETYKHIMRAKMKFDKHNIPYNILSVLTNQAARYPQKIWKFILQENIEYIQFIPCLDKLNYEILSPYALRPERFYNFYSNFFSLWVRHFQSGRYVSVKLFDDLINLYVRGFASACGMNGKCAIQFVAESDGMVYPCDFYVQDEYCMGSLAEQRPSDLFINGETFIKHKQPHLYSQPCIDCKYKTSCAGGCKRMKDFVYISKGICWYSKLLDEILPSLLQIGRLYQ